VRELQALGAPKTPQGVLVRGHAGRVINKLSFRAPGKFADAVEAARKSNFTRTWKEVLVACVQVTANPETPNK